MIGIRVGPFGSKTVTGKAIFVVPFLQRIDYMTLENIQVDFVSKDSIPTQDAINIKVDAVFGKKLNYFMIFLCSGFFKFILSIAQIVVILHRKSFV